MSELAHDQIHAKLIGHGVPAQVASKLHAIKPQLGALPWLALLGLIWQHGPQLAAMAVAIYDCIKTPGALTLAALQAAIAQYSPSLQALLAQILEIFGVAMPTK